LSNPTLLLKATELTFSTIYCQYRNIVNFSHAIRIHFC